jgi:hypothetical protein
VQGAGMKRRPRGRIRTVQGKWGAIQSVEQDGKVGEKAAPQRRC